MPTLTTRIIITLLAVAVIAGCSSMKSRPVEPSVDYPMTRPISVVTDQPINPIIQ